MQADHEFFKGSNIHLGNFFQIFFQLILWMAPTFFWPGEPIPLAPQQQSRVGAAQERFGSLIENLGGSSPANIYNRLMCPQCVTQQLAIFFLGVSMMQKLVCALCFLRHG